VSLSRNISFVGEETLSWAVPKLWAREKIGRLMLEQGTGTSNRGPIIGVSVEHQVLSDYTAFLASAPQAVGGGPVTTSLESKRPGLHVHGHGRGLEVSVRGGLLRLDWKGAEPVRSIRIFDLHGREVFRYRPGTGLGLFRWIWDGRDHHDRKLPRGRYLVGIQTDQGIATRSFEWDPTGI
jgi:hypothetical protein